MPEKVTITDVFFRCSECGDCYELEAEAIKCEASHDDDPSASHDDDPSASHDADDDTSASSNIIIHQHFYFN